MAHILVVGNEKGGAGKSTVSMHLATALARMGWCVGVLDLDLRQLTLARYIENRMRYCEKAGLDLPSPFNMTLPELPPESLAPDENPLEARFGMAMASLRQRADFILLDCPGSHTRLSQLAHSLADTLITPLNDSFIDFDMLAHTDLDGMKVERPAAYSEMVWKARQMRAGAGLKAIDWVVMRNRLGSQQMVNKRKMAQAIEALSKRIGFRAIPGFSERVIFRELFPTGLTLLDLGDTGVKQLNMSNIAARQELRDMITALRLPGVSAEF